MQWKTATTTRYWDCNVPYCEPNNSPYPHSYAMKAAVNDPNGAIIYGTAAASDSILQGKAACGKCFLLKASNTASPKIVVKVNNWCPCQYNPSCCSDHFDITVPGFDWAAGSVSNVCSQKDKSINYVGSPPHQVCQNWYLGQPCNCKSVSSDPLLQAGCNLFLSLKWDNPSVDYQEVACPSSISGITSDANAESDSTVPIVPVVVGVSVGVVALVAIIGILVYVRRRSTITEVV